MKKQPVMPSRQSRRRASAGPQLALWALGMTIALLATPASSQDGAPAAVPGETPALPAAAAFPEGSPQQLEFLDVSKDLRCPTCTGLSVLESDAPFSNQIKDIVKEQVQAGKSKDEILKYFTERYGPWILRSPPKEGFNLVAWGLPILVLIAGPPLIWLLVWRRKRIVATMGVRSTDVILAEMQQRLDAMRRA